MKKKQIIILSIIALLFACKKESKINRLGLEQYTMEVSIPKLFNLDSTTTQSTTNIQFIADTENSKLFYFNKPMNNICVFDVETGKELYKIQLRNNGPDVIKGVQGFFYENKDSIWVYKSMEKELILINNKGIIQYRVNPLEKLHKETDNQFSTSPYPMTDLPLKKAGDKVILQGMNGPHENKYPSSTTIFDIKNKSTSIVNPYPPIYEEGTIGQNNMNNKWGTFTYRAVPYDLNNENEMILSFPADDSISIYNIDSDKTKRYFAGYSSETDIKPIKAFNSRTELDRHYLENYQYAGIFYDKNKKLYYRILMLPTTDYDLNNEESQQKGMVIIILNNNFQKVGEYKLPKDKYMYRNCFVGKNAFYINVYSDDDDYLKFITLKTIQK